MLASVLWCAGVLVHGVQTMDVAWPFAEGRMVYVTYSLKAEPWEFPAKWGAERIEAAVDEKLRYAAERERAWAAALPEERKVACKAITSSTRPADRPDDCVRLEWALSEGVIWKSGTLGWGDQLKNPQLSVAAAIVRIAPFAIAPPVFLIAFGSALIWAFAGFSRGL
jgi:hypothetical protein